MARTVTFDVLAVAKAIGFDELGDKIKKAAGDAKTHVSWLVTAIAAVGPAMVPIAAGATALGLGLTGLGAAGILAFAGIRTEIKQGTVLGLAYQKTFKTISDEFHALSYLSAVQVFTGINTAVSSSRRLFPQLATDVSLLAGQLGQIVSHVAPGLVALFTRLNPLFLAVGAELVKLSAGFERWATSGTGVTKFVAYAQANLPRVEKLIGQLATAVVHLTQGLAPLGGVSLSTIGVFLRLFNAIPINVLQRIAPIITGIVLATKTWEVSSKALNIVLEANPFVRIATLILAIGTALVIAYQTSEKFRRVVQQVFIDVAKAALDAISFIYHGFYSPFLTMIASILDALSHLPFGLGKPFKAAAREVRGLRDGIGDMIDTAQRKMDTLQANLDTRKANAKIKDLQGRIGAIRQGKVPGIRADTYQAAVAIRSLQIQIAAIQGKTVAINIVTNYQTGIDKRAAGSAGTNLAQRASGGPVTRGTPYIVGEHSPEVFIPNANGYIVPTNTGSGTAWGGGDTYIINLNGAVLGNTDQVVDAIAKGLERRSGRGAKLHVRTA